MIDRLTGFHLHRGALAAMHRPTVPTVAETVHGARRVLVLEDIVDHTNVGAVFRSCRRPRHGCRPVTPRCADPLARAGDSVPMGTVFQVPWTRIDPWPAGVEALGGLLHDRGLALEEESRPLDELAADPPERLASRPRHRG